MSQTPTIGRIVHYRLSASEAEEINARRRYGTGVERTCNPVGVGQILAAQIVATWGTTTVNLAVQLDGACQHWATSRTEGDEPGQWFWPPRV